MAAGSGSAPGRGRFALAVLAGATALAGCATAPAGLPDARASAPGAGREVIGAAVTQPLDDLNITGEAPASPLIVAQAGPFREPSSCAAADHEAETLDGALRAAAPAPAPTAMRVGAAVVGSFVRLPFRGVVRELSGASARAHAEQTAIRAGLLRRGYLEGWRREVCRPVGPIAAGGAAGAWK